MWLAPIFLANTGLWPEAVGGHYVEEYHQGDAEDYEIDSEVLRDCTSLVKGPPAMFEWVVVPDTLNQKTCDAVENEQKAKGTARPCEYSGQYFVFFLRSSPDQI